MSFSKIVGQDRVLQILKNVHKYSKVSHAYIFAGVDSCGKKLIALEFSKLLNCQNPNENGACDECISCKKIDADNHPEVTVYKPEKSTITIDIIRDIQHVLQFKKYESNYRFLIVEDADKMNKEASNCFLKTLEEPPEFTVIILLSNSLTNIIKTIHSRSQIVKFKSLSQDDKLQIIKANTGFENEKISEAINLAGQHLASAIAILSNKEFSEISTQFNGIYESLFIRTNLNFSVLKELENIAKEKEKFGSFLTFLLNKVELEQILCHQEKVSLILRAQQFFRQNINPKFIANWLFLSLK